jgi:hypothetical protein
MIKTFFTFIYIKKKILNLEKEPKFMSLFDCHVNHFWEESLKEFAKKFVNVLFKFIL